MSHDHTHDESVTEHNCCGDPPDFTTALNTLSRGKDLISQLCEDVPWTDDEEKNVILYLLVQEFRDFINIARANAMLAHAKLEEIQRYCAAHRQGETYAPLKPKNEKSPS